MQRTMDETINPDAVAEANETAFNNQTIVHVDNMWTTQGKAVFQIISLNQGGNSGGEHYVQLEHERVSANGMQGSESTHFRVFTSMGMSMSPEVLLMLECIGGPYTGCMLAIVNDRLTLKKKSHDYETVDDAEPEVLFKKLRQSHISKNFMIQHAHNESQFIGFDEAGKALTPSEVDPSSPEGQFFVWSISKGF